MAIRVKCPELVPLYPIKGGRTEEPVTSTCHILVGSTLWEHVTKVQAEPNIVRNKGLPVAIKELKLYIYYNG